MAHTQSQGSQKSHVIPLSTTASNPYWIGDVYRRLRPDFQNPPLPDPVSSPYLARLAQVSQSWPYMQYLVDFMQATCAPPKRHDLTESDRAERASRVKIALLEFPHGKDVQRTNISNVTDLRIMLQHHYDLKDPDARRLFVVEDLSRDVIEALGQCFNIDPRFFRGHISDYSWYNTRDPWIELPELDVFAAKRNFFQMRFVQARYFTSEESLRKARAEADGFNVLRRIDMEPDRAANLDEPRSVVGMVRSKVSMWTRPEGQFDCGVLGILLVDPSVSEGYPLWSGYSYFDDHDGIFLNDSTAKPHWCSVSAFEDFIYWTKHLKDNEKMDISRDPRVFALKKMMMVIANWKITLEYATTRLTQVEWEVEDPIFRTLPGGDGLDGCLRRLHRWRRVLPIYHSMVSSTLCEVIQRNPGNASAKSCVSDLLPDYQKTLDQIVALQNRAERIAALVGTMISIEENRKAIEQNANLTRLTYLASVFIPMSFLASLFSMSSNLRSLEQTFWIYFAVAIPTTATCIFVTVYVYSDRRVSSRSRRATEVAPKLPHPGY